MTETRIELDFDRAVQLAREVIAEYGERHIYVRVADAEGDATCVYVDEGSCSCLVGHILHRAGVPLASLESHNNRGVGDDLFLTDVGVTADDRTADFLERLQDSQDSGNAWGSALAWALHEDEAEELVGDDDPE
jgi:hypothetical protein